MEENKMNKKKLLLVLLPLLTVALVSALVLTYYGAITQNVDVEQAVTLSGVGCTNNECDDTISETIYSGDTLISEVYTLTNLAGTSRDVNLGTTYNPGVASGEIVTTYLKSVDYAYSADIAGVGVDVTDEGEWLQWNYTYSDVPTHTPKMTVEINYPNGFAVTTFDDGHEGWYYYDTTIAEARFADYVGGTYSDFVETTAVGNVLTVRIKKSALDNEFKWHGYANLDGVGVWINAGKTGNGYSDPLFEVSLQEALNLPYTLQGGEALDFVVSNYFNTTGFDGTITTTVTP